MVHSALRGMLRDVKIDGYSVPDLRALYDRQMLTRLARPGEDVEIDPYTADERDRLLEGFRRHRAHYHAFVFFMFWTGARPSEALALATADSTSRDDGPEPSTTTKETALSVTKKPRRNGAFFRAGDRGRTGDVQLGKGTEAKVQDFDQSG